MRRHIFFGVLMVAAAICLHVAAGDAGPARPDLPVRPLRILSGPLGGQWHAMGEKLAAVLCYAGIPAVNEVGGGVENLRLVGEGEADIGFTLSSFLGAAGAGEKELPKVNLDNAVLLSCLYSQVFYLIVRGDTVARHDLKSVRDFLRVKASLRLATLPKGTGSEFLLKMLLTGAYATSYAQLERQGWNIMFRNYEEIAAGFSSGEFDACAFTLGVGARLIPELEKRDGSAVILPIDYEILGLMTRKFMTFTSFIEPRDHGSVTERLATLGDYSCLVVQNALPEDLVYAINAAMWAGRSQFAKISADMKRFSPRIATSGRNKMHPGSLRFWNSPEMEVLKKIRRRR